MRVLFSTKKVGNAKRAMKEYIARNGEKAMVGHAVACVHLIQASQPLCPVDTEALVKSAIVAKKGDGFGAVFYVGYGMKDLPGPLYFIYGPGQVPFEMEGYSKWKQADVLRIPADYAKKQHWDETLNHYGRGQALFLQQPLRTERDEMRRLIREEVRA